MGRMFPKMEFVGKTERPSPTASGLHFLPLQQSMPNKCLPYVAGKTLAKYPERYNVKPLPHPLRVSMNNVYRGQLWDFGFRQRIIPPLPPPLAHSLAFIREITGNHFEANGKVFFENELRLS